MGVVLPDCIGEGYISLKALLRWMLASSLAYLLVLRAHAMMEEGSDSYTATGMLNSVSKT